MSRLYRLGITISSLKDGEELAAQEAAEECCHAWGDDWQYETLPDKTHSLTSTGEYNLVGGQTEEEFSAEVAQSIWRKLGRYVLVSVETVCLEYLPVETFTMDENAYTQAKNAGLLAPEEERG